MRTKFNGILTLFLALIVQISFAQEKTISGTVSDESGPLPGVTILKKGTTQGTETDFDGNYSIQAKTGDILIFSFVGMKTVERTIGSSNQINVILEGDNLLEEVVVIAYGQQDRKKLVQSVSTIDNENIRDIPAVSPQELLQGQASGVQVVSSSGILGSAPVIKIRGVASISSGGRPLIVIDGVPMNDAVVTGGQGGQGLNPLADINPNDIESFSVLKDAAATAVYGSRGSNGVVLITTKQGKKNQDTKIDVDMSTSWSESTDTFDMMNADEFRSYLAEVGFGGGDPNNLPQGSFDWVPAVVRTGMSRKVNINVTGGSEKTTFYLGGSYSDQEGFIIGNKLERLSARLNLTHQAKDWLRVGMNLSVSENKNDRVGSENSTFAPLTSAVLQSPWVEPYDADGNFVNTGFIANVLAIESLDTNVANTFRTTGNLFGEIKLSESLNFRTDFGIDRVTLDAFQRSVEINSPDGFAQNTVNQQNKFVFTNTLNYATTIGDVHDINAVAGMSYEQVDRRNIIVDATGFLSDDQINTVSASTPGTTNNTATGSRLAGYFARANYSYDNKYVIEGSIRRDGSSKFGANNKYGTFWSVGGAWLISQENFLNDSSWLSNLKLRANYGESGNDRIGNFASLENFQGGIISNYNGSSGIRQLSAPNPNLKWEKSESYDIGFEAGFLENKIRLNVDYYNKKTTDLILNVPIPQSNGGINSIIDNVGSMENKGWDIDLSADIIRGEDFSWTSSLNVGINENKVLSLPGANLDAQGRRFVAGSTVQRAIEGHSVNSFYLIRYKGVNPETGDAEWLDVDGNPTTNPTSADRVIAGDANPDFVGGFRNTLKYKDFDLNFFFNFSVGNDLYVSGLRFTDNPASTFNNRTALLDVWRNPGDNAYVPSFSSPTFGTFAQRSTLQLRDGSYARLKNITLGYNVPKAVAERLGFLKGVRLYATANNIWTIKADDMDGIDPEVTDALANGRQGETFFTPPQSKTYLVGVRLTF
ncbi:SusC/RagA family TonB-linked outer membrane protein [Tenacibaculum discolor]|uniref:SusC/RagA family TonB-linked outer membrane protein n=1 Tax=Tenacibaculum discolor TaxID=361581 RepID=UPI000F5A1CA4|nr:TonB-dependent receptor [Tenacibaculum discolor]